MHHILSEREKSVLRLLSRGYDIKAAARELNVSEGNITERLREVRKKLGVSSSREAARIFADFENQQPIFYGDRNSGIANIMHSGSPCAPPEKRVETDAENLSGSMVEKQISHMPFRGFSGGFMRLPLRGKGEAGNSLGLWDRVAAIIDISTKLAALFALTCLIAISVNLLIQ